MNNDAQISLSGPQSVQQRNCAIEHFLSHVFLISITHSLRALPSGVIWFLRDIEHCTRCSSCGVSLIHRLGHIIVHLRWWTKDWAIMAIIGITTDFCLIWDQNGRWSNVAETRYKFPFHRTGLCARNDLMVGLDIKLTTMIRRLRHGVFLQDILEIIISAKVECTY